MSQNGIELIIFDLGRVLIDFDFLRVIRELAKESSLSEDQIRHYFETTPLWDRFERGHVAPEPFFQQVKNDLQLKRMDFAEFSVLWNNIFTEKHDSVEILRTLRERYKIAMLSNVNVMHWEHIQGRHDFTKLFHYPITSYAAGHRKPEPEIFHYVLKHANVRPEKAVFIDDIESHVTAAKSLRIRAHQFSDALQLRKDLADLL